MIELPITTKRLMIRRLDSRDLDDFLQFMLDSESTKYLAFESEQTTAKGAKILFEHVIQAYDTNEHIHSYAIADRVSDLYIGSCGFAPYEVGVVECYYCVNRRYRGMGIATEASREMVAVLGKFFEVRAYCHSDNFAAHAVAINAGMKRHGFARHKHSRLEGELFVIEKEILTTE